jgi:drug/metabolite transporter superfamily protein YnfA
MPLNIRLRSRACALRVACCCGSPPLSWLWMCGFVPPSCPIRIIGRVLAAYGEGVVAASLAWGVIVDRFGPDRWGLLGARSAWPASQ